MALIQLTLLYGLHQFLQHPDRFVGRRAADWSLDDSVVLQLRDRYLYPVNRLILSHASERAAREREPPAAFALVLPR